MPLAGFEPTNLASEQLHTKTLDHPATGIGCLGMNTEKKYRVLLSGQPVNNLF